MKIKQIILGCTIALASASSLATTSTESRLVNFTTDEHGILFSTTYHGDSTCRQSWGNEYRISIKHPNYKAMASTLLAISLDPKNSPFTFSFDRRALQGLSSSQCSEIDGIHRYIGL